MRLVGAVEIFGTVYKATLAIHDNNRGDGVTWISRTKKWKAQRIIDGKMCFFGYYDDRDEATEAARLRVNLAREKRKATAGATEASGVTYDGMWRIKLTLEGKRVSLGRYATYGHAVLVRDVVARRTGKPVIVDDYEMPLSLVNDPVARSYIRDRVPPSTAADMAEYQRRVDALNGGERPEPVQPPALTLPPELWRQRQPSRAGRSPFDVL